MQTLSILAASALVATHFLLVQAQETPGVTCYNNAGGLQDYGTNIYQTQGQCQGQCEKMNYSVWATTHGDRCYCGHSFPAIGQVDYTQNCNVKCLSWTQMCGGANAWTFGTTGVSQILAPGYDAAHMPAESSSVAESSSSTSPTTTTLSSSSSSSQSTPAAIVATSFAPGQTVSVIAPLKSTSTSTALPEAATGSKATVKSSGAGASTAGIAAGVVVGLVIAAAIGLGVWFFLRRRKRLEQEEDFRNQLSSKEFVQSTSKPQSDHRLDPVMLQQRRLSDGSIADNQDFSRRILKVANPDD